MATMRVFKVNALPAAGQLTPSAVYFVKDGAGFVQYITDSAGAVTYRAKADPLTMSFDRYDLPVATSANGVFDLSKNQVFKIDAKTAGTAITMNFTNPPAGKSMVVVVQVVGSTRSVNIPTGAVVMESVDNTLGAVMSVMTFFYDGSKFYLMNNAKINA